MKRSLLLVFILSLTVPATAEIYRWKDANGKTVISDKPPVGQVAQKKPESTEAVATPAPKTPSLADRDLDFRKRQKDAKEKADKAREEETSSQEKQENCSNARRQLSALESGERIALRDDKGERYFMEDDQRAQETGKVRGYIDANCR
jgi:hypothetical protein